ncbi:tetratricopeptide repeat protein [Nannocystaceae bacterium ST9]
MSTLRTPAATEGDATLAGDGDEPLGPPSGAGSRWPARLGHYVVLQELGHGGMGIVCAAYDQVLDRKVAIKLLHARGDALAQVRLIREAQALARLSHPNVVQIYEIGEFEGLAFIVMEFVDGVTLREWLRAEPRSRKAILATFDAAGRGLAAAHAEGLVHRDFKPDNVMIRGDGRVLVMDFGLARGEASEVSEAGEVSERDEPDASPETTSGPLAERVESPTLARTLGGSLSGSRGSRLSVELTRTGALLGTPAYMAPEQFRGLETNAKTDQFAFCVALWEALCGARPFAGDNLAAISLAVTTATIVAPPAGLPSWLRKQLERGLAREPERRWPSMAALLAALRDDPTRARRGWIAALGVGLLAASIALGVSIARERETEAARTACELEGRAIADDWTDDDRRAIEQAFLASELDSAGETWTRVQRAMDAYAQTWTELRTQACVETRVEARRDPSDYAALAECLDEHRTTFATLVDTWHAPTRRQVAGASSAAGYLPALSTCADPALLAARVRMPDDLATRERVIALRHRLERVRALGLTLDYEAGRSEAAAVLSEAQALAWKPLVAEARLALARMHENLGDYDEARTSMTLAFDDAGEAGHDLLALEAANALVYLVGHRLAKPESGLVWSEVSGMLIARLGLTGSLHEARRLDQLGVLRDDLGEYTLALDLYERALAIREARLGPDNLTVALSLDHLGGTHRTLDHNHDARVLLERALAIREDLLGPEHVDVAAVLDNLGGVQFSENDYDEARATFERSLAIWTALLGPDHIDVTIPLGNLGALQIQQGEYSQAIATFERVLKIQEATLGSEHTALVNTIGNMAQARRLHGDLEGALLDYRRAIGLLERNLGPDHPGLVFHLHHYGVALAEAGEHEQARVQLERVLAIELTDEASTPGMIATTRFALADSLWQLGEHERAREQAASARGLLPGDDGLLAEILAWQAAHE